jgi:membrane protein
MCRSCCPLQRRHVAHGGKLALLYGSFAGVVATLVFLYISATTLIFGAEVNGVLRATVVPPQQ